MRQYRVSEIFLSIQGEGARAGTENVFVRFGGCNLKCAMAKSDLSPGGFDCDTDFESAVTLTEDELLARIAKFLTEVGWVILTGGEPMLQVDSVLVDRLHEMGFKVAIETNGTRRVPDNVDYICVSPKVAEHTIKQTTAHEARYVRGVGQPLPKTRVNADRYFISPAFDGNTLSEESLEWAKKLVMDNPSWELSIQLHKLHGMR